MTLWFSRTQHTEKSNSFLLSMVSPVWRTNLCGELGTDKPWALDMSEEDASVFLQVVALGCGKTVVVAKGLDSLEGLIEILGMADRYQVKAILGDLEEAVMDRLTVQGCWLILTMVCGSGLVRLERASRKLALREFDQFAECVGFMGVSESLAVGGGAGIAAGRRCAGVGERGAGAEGRGALDEGRGWRRDPRRGPAAQDPISVHVVRIPCS
jgi:hypothetical protein